ncbi:hypothetical protein BB561_000707 [Smittium simulii]|uniref:Uncharacterized protein n=1 Tax=Smittium simulii TaxID=133385 RepID=A0A2T9YY03_9FUNG|nr:hypothetical protein BB561_000707 [Smittium simulii]
MEDTFNMLASTKNTFEYFPLLLSSSTADLGFKNSSNHDMDIIEILQSVSSLFDPKPSIINTKFPHRLRLTTDQPVHARVQQYSPKETRVLKKHVIELYDTGYARPLISYPQISDQKIV